MSSEQSRSLLFIDSCAVNRFALVNLDPVKALRESAFRVAYTPALAAEYRRALAHRFVEPHIKAMLHRLLDHGLAHSIGSPDYAADDGLVAMTETAFVITLDRRPPWDRAEGRPGLILWRDLERDLQAGATLPGVLQVRAALPSAA